MATFKSGNKVAQTQDSSFLKLVEGIAFCPFTDRIYVATGHIDYLLILSPSGELLSKIRVDAPWGVCFFNSIICVTGFSDHSVSLMTLNGELITTFGRNYPICQQNLQNTCLYLDNPTRLAADSNDLYICDSRNNRILKLSPDHPLCTEIGVGFLNTPEDVHIWQQKIFVLDWKSPCIAIFNSEGEFLKRIITKGSIRSDVSNVYCFTLDARGNLLLSDCESDSIRIFSSDGKSISKIGKRGEEKGKFEFPMGIAINSKSQIVSVCRRERFCIQFFT